MDKGYYSKNISKARTRSWVSQSTIKMDKGYYLQKVVNQADAKVSQSTIKMDKGYYFYTFRSSLFLLFSVAIHNKNGQGLLLDLGYEFFDVKGVAIHNKNGQGLLLNVLQLYAQEQQGRNPQ